MRRSSWSPMTLLAIVQALTFLQLIERTEASFISDRSRAHKLPFSNRHISQRPRQFQQDLRQGCEAKVSVVNLRSSAQDETNGKASASASPAVSHIQDRDGNDNNHNHRMPGPGPVPNSSTLLHVNSQNCLDDDKSSGATLGDIMSDGLGLQMTSHSSSGTRKSTGTEGTSSASLPSSSSSSSLAEQYGIIHPLDRMALTANGNLQRLVSSYYDAPVSVVVDSCTQRDINPTNGATSTVTSPAVLVISSSSSSSAMVPPTTSIWDRTVHLTVFGGQTFCTAVSVITVHDPLCQQLVQSGQVGLGQLFRYLDLLPEFTLRGAGVGTGKGALTGKGHDDVDDDTREVSSSAAGSGKGTGFWRDYTLSCAELTCDIHEEFRPGLWDMQPRDNHNEHPNRAS